MIAKARPAECILCDKTRSVVIFGTICVPCMNFPRRALGGDTRTRALNPQPSASGDVDLEDLN